MLSCSVHSIAVMASLALSRAVFCSLRHPTTLKALPAALSKLHAPAAAAASTLQRRFATSSVALHIPAAHYSAAVHQPRPAHTAAAADDQSVAYLINPPFDAAQPRLPPVSPLLASWLRPHTPGPLSEAELQQYQQWGYCIKRGVLSDEDLQPAMRAVEAQVDQVAHELHAAGLIRDPCSELDLFHRLTALEKQYPDCSVLLHKLGVLDDGIARLWEQPNLLAIAKQIIGPAVAAHPNWSIKQSFIPALSNTAALCSHQP